MSRYWYSILKCPVIGTFTLYIEISKDCTMYWNQNVLQILSKYRKISIDFLSVPACAPGRESMSFLWHSCLARWCYGAFVTLKITPVSLSENHWTFRFLRLFHSRERAEVRGGEVSKLFFCIFFNECIISQEYCVEISSRSEQNWRSCEYWSVRCSRPGFYT